MDARRSGWIRRLAEATTITLSILIAFSIDAWWDGVQERSADRSHLESVLRELQTTANLLDDAVRLHRQSQAQALAVLEVTSAGQLTVTADSLESLVVSLWSSYLINPPTGALQAATLAGTIARLPDQELKDQLLGWDGLLEDLLEEEVTGSENATAFLHDFLARRVSMRGIFAAYRVSVSGEVIGAARRSLPPSRHSPGVESLLNDREFENKVLGLLMLAQVSEDEGRAFRVILSDVIQRVESVLGGAVF